MLGRTLRDDLAAFHDDFPGVRTFGWIDDILNRNLFLNFRRRRSRGDLLFLDHVAIKRTDNIRVLAELRIHRPEQRHHGKLVALVDSDSQRIPLGEDDLDPASPLRDDAAAINLAVALLVLDEVHPRTAVELTDHHSFGPVDDKLPTAKHDGNFAEKDLFFNRLILLEPQPDAERSSVRQAELLALLRGIPRLAQLVPDVFQAQRLIEVFNRECFAEERL